MFVLCNFILCDLLYRHNCCINREARVHLSILIVECVVFVCMDSVYHETSQRSGPTEITIDVSPEVGRVGLLHSMRSSKHSGRFSGLSLGCLVYICLTPLCTTSRKHCYTLIFILNRAPELKNKLVMIRVWGKSKVILQLFSFMLLFLRKDNAATFHTLA